VRPPLEPAASGVGASVLSALKATGATLATI
jgi:hypothetical protein